MLVGKLRNHGPCPSHQVSWKKMPLILRGHHGHPIFRLIWASDKISVGYWGIDHVSTWSSTIQVSHLCSNRSNLTLTRRCFGWWDGCRMAVGCSLVNHRKLWRFDDSRQVNQSVNQSDIGVIFLPGLFVQPRSNFWAVPGISTSALHLVQAPKSSILSSSKWFFHDLNLIKFKCLDQRNPVQQIP